MIFASWRRPATRDDSDPESPGPEVLAEDAAWERVLAALDVLDERLAAYLSAPSDPTADQLVWAEVELEDAIALAGEFEVYDLRWGLR